jgi:hypothetical protein
VAEWLAEVQARRVSLSPAWRLAVASLTRLVLASRATRSLLVVPPALAHVVGAPLIYLLAVAGTAAPVQALEVRRTGILAIWTRLGPSSVA